MATERWIVDTDNGLGGPRGDVDDGFALAALWAGGAQIEGISSVFGNTTEEWAWQNTLTAAYHFRWKGRLLRGASRPGPGVSPAARHYAKSWTHTSRILALGPLTNIAQALALGAAVPQEVVVVGGNSQTWGKWPPVWPFEFNLTKDPWATHTVFASDTPLTLIPLNVCGRLKLPWAAIAGLEGPAGKWIAEGSHRWWRRARWLGQRRVPVWDLVAAWYAMAPEAFSVGEARVKPLPNGGVRWNAGDRRVQWIQELDSRTLWSRFETFLSGCRFTVQS